MLKQHTKSQSLLKTAYEIIPSASQTFSKGPTQWPSLGPNFLEKGDGAWVWDVDGNKYLDYIMALGPIILGYNHPTINEAIIKQLNKGITFSQMHPLEVEVAELLVENIPCAEMVRFGKNGSDVTTAAIRAARAYTGKDHILQCGYHGWHDWYIGTTTRNLGVPSCVSSLTHSFSYNNIKELEDLFNQYHNQVAAVILEPISIEAPKEDFLQQVKTLAHANGALLIFDEIVTGARIDIGGAQKYFDVIPDMACFGKAIANGMPLSTVVGRKEIMKIFDDIFFSGTFGGETLSLAACKATLNFIKENNVCQNIYTYGEKLSQGINELLNKHTLSDLIKLDGHPSRTLLAAKNPKDLLAMRNYIMQECIKLDLLYYCMHMPSFSHQEKELDFTLQVLDSVFEKVSAIGNLGDLDNHISGKKISAIFRKA